MIVRVLDTVLSVETDDDDLMERVGAVLGSYAGVSEPATVHWRLEASNLRGFRDGQLEWENFGSVGELVAVFEQQLIEDAMKHAAPGFLVHSAVLANRRSALVLFGRSGAGKTTMSRSLIARGAKYVTDEVAAIDARGRARGLSRPLGLLPDDPPLEPRARELRGSIVRHDYIRAEGEHVRRAAFALDRSHVQHEPVAVDAIVHLQHDPSSPPGLVSLSPGALVEPLWGERFRGGRDELEIVLDLVHRVPTYRLITSTIEQACADLERAWSWRDG